MITCVTESSLTTETLLPNASQNNPHMPPKRSPSDPPTRYSIVKDNWGSFPNFLLSYGLKLYSKPLFTPYIFIRISYAVDLDPDDVDEGNRILDQLLENALEDYYAKQAAGGK